MGNMFAILMPVIIGLNGILLIVLEMIDSAKREKQQKMTEDEKERNEIKERWKNCEK